MAETKTIRALERGLDVMRALEGQQAASLNDLYLTTGLPRPTLLRILLTLEKAGIVRRGIGDGLYRSTFGLQRLGGGLDEFDHLAEVAAPLLDRLCQQVKWPSDLIVMNHELGDCMEIKETSRPNSPFTINRDHIGHLIAIPQSAVGRAYLAFCPEAERDQILSVLRASPKPANRLVRAVQRFDAVLEQIRKDGYATREPGFVGGDYATGRLYDDGIAAIAVPLRDGDAVYGCINLVWLRTSMGEADLVVRHLETLQATAAEITAAYTAVA